MKHVCPHCNKEFDTKKEKKFKVSKNYKVGKRKPFKRMKKILNFLKEQDDWTWIRRIAKGTGMYPYSVSYLLEKYLDHFVEIVDPEDVYESTGIKMKLIRLKNKEIDVDKVIKELKIRTNS